MIKRVCHLVFLLTLLIAFTLPAAAQTVGAQPLWSREGESDAVTSLFFSPDGKNVVITYKWGRMRILDAGTRCVKHVFAPALKSASDESHEFYSAAMSPDGKLVAVGDSQGIVYLLDAADATLIRQVKPFAEQGVISLDFSPDGKELLAASRVNEGVKVYGVPDLSPNLSIPLPQYWIGEARFTLDESRIVIGNSDGFESFDASTGKSVSHIECAISGCAISPDRKTFAHSIGSGPKFIGKEIVSGVAIRSLADGKIVGAFPCYGPVAYSSDGKYILSAGPDFYQLSLWDVSTSAQVRLFENAPEVVTNADISPDGKTVMSADSEGNVRTWDALTGNLLETNCFNRYGIDSIAFSPDGTRLSTYDTSGYQNFIWNTEDGRFISEPSFMIAEAKLPSLQFFGTGRDYLRIGEEAIELFDEGGNLYQSFPTGKAKYYGACPSPNGDTAAMRVEGKVGYIQIIDLKTGKALKSFRDGLGFPGAMAYTADGKTLVVAYDKGELRVLDPVKGGTRFTIKQGTESIRYLTVSPDGRFFAAAAYAYDTKPVTACVYDLAKGKKVAEIALSDGIKSLCFTPDSAFLATGDFVNGIQFFGVADWKKRSGVKIEGKSACLIFSPDGTKVAYLTGYGVVVRAFTP